MTSTAPTSVNEQGAYRELVFEGYASDSEQVSLMIKDYSEDQAKTGFYKIPLGFANTTQNNNNADVELVYIYPLCECTPDGAAERKLTNLRPGYLYIYVDGHLWRELEVTEHEEEDIAYFKDVNLAYQKGPQAWRIDEHGQVGERVATGEQLKQVLVPNKLYGQPCRVEIAFSETQWCWRQIEAFGGMSENDPRLNYGPRVQPGTNDAAASERRSQRMQVLDKLGNYAQGYSNDEAPQHIPLPRMPKNGLHRPVLKDPIGVARYLAAEIVSERKNIQQLSMESIKGAPLTPDDFEDFAPEQKNISKHVLASTIQSQFFAFPNTTQQKVDLGMSVYEHEQDMAQNYKSWVRAGFSKHEFRRYLKTEQALSSARAINVQKSFGFDHITREDAPMSFYQAVKDYGYYDDVRRNFVYELISDVTAPYTDLTKTLIESFLVHDSDFRAAKQIDEEDMGQELMLKVLGTHPLDTENAANSLKLTALMYPKNTGTALSDYECARRESSDPFDTVFSVELQQQIQQDIDEGLMSGEQREFWRRASQMIWGVLAISFAAPASFFAVGGAGTNLKSRTVDRNEQEAKLKDQIRDLDNEIKGLEKDIKSKNDEIKEVQRAHNEVREALEEAMGIKGRKAFPQELELYLQDRIQELDALHDGHTKAQAQIIRAQQSVKNMRIASMPHEKVDFRNVKVHLRPYVRFRHLAKVATGDLLQEIEIDAGDYYSNKLPDGKLPLNFTDRAKRAEERIEKLGRLAERFDYAYKEQKTRRPTVTLKMNKLHSVQSRIDQMIALDGALDEILDAIERQQAEMKSGQASLKKKLLVLDVSKIDGLKEEIRENSDSISSKEIKQLEADWALKGLKSDNSALNKMASMNIHPEKFDSLLKGILPAVGILEAANLFDVLSDDTSTPLDRLSAWLDAIDIGGNIGLNMVERRIGLPSVKQSYAVLRNKPVPASAFKERVWLVSKLKFGVYFGLLGNAATFLASAVSAYVSFYNMRGTLGRGDTAQAIGHGLMMTGFAGMTLSSAIAIGAVFTTSLQGAAVAVLAPALAIVGLLLLLIGAGVVWAFSEAPIEGWLEACHWGTYKTRFKDDDGNQSTMRASLWKDNPELAIHDLYNALYAPQFKVTSSVGTVKYQLFAPMVNKKNGADVRMYWRNISKGEQTFKRITDYQISLLTSEIEIFPGRTGWQFSTTYTKLEQVLGLAHNQEIEFKAEFVTFPYGKGAKILEHTEQEYALPIRITKPYESLWQQIKGVSLPFVEKQGGMYLKKTTLFTKYPDSLQYIN